MTTPAQSCRTSPSAKSDQGASVVTFMLLLPLLIMFAELIVVGGRMTAVQADLNAAARQAARQGSVAVDAESAQAQLDKVVGVVFANAGRECVDFVAVLGPGTDYVAGGLIEVEVTCRVSFSDISLLRVPGEKSLTGRAAEPIDKFREVG